MNITENNFRATNKSTQVMSSKAAEQVKVGVHPVRFLALSFLVR